MRPMLKQMLLSLGVLFLFCLPAQKACAQFDNVSESYNDFYMDLANYGQWIEDPRYGYVWSPNVDGTFRPYYSNGYWAMTEYGNTWISDFPWGWACFHYGRWTYDAYYGWLWIPGPNWGPAWVSWRYGDGFYGWAPLGPDYNFNGDYICPNSWWVFIPPQYLYSGSYYRYWYGPRGNHNIIPNTTFVTNTYVTNNITYVNGPRKKEVEDFSHQPVQVFHLANSRSLNTTVHNNTVKMYHPMQVKQVASMDGQRVSPPNMVHAPQPIKPSQPVKTEEPVVPAFRNSLPKSSYGHDDPPGANLNETAKPQTTPQPNYKENPYEYDVNRPLVQPQPRQDAPQPPVRTQPQPRQQQAPQPPRITTPPQPVQQPRTPAPAPSPAQTPAPYKPENNAGRR